MIYREELPLRTQNKSVSDIQMMYEDLDDARILFRASCEDYLKRFLKDTDEEHPYKCDITLDQEDACGLSSLLMPKLDSIYLLPYEYIPEKSIVFNIDGSEMAIESVSDYELLQIIDEISK